MRYTSKADILGRLWKSRSDVRLIDRMVGRGEIKKWDWYYEVDENFFIKWLNEYDKNMTLSDKDKDIVEANIEYYERKIGMYKEWYRKMINGIYVDLKATQEYIEWKNERIDSMEKWVERECDK